MIDLEGVQWFILRKTIIFLRFQRGSNNFQGGPKLITIENYSFVIFQRGRVVRIPKLRPEIKVTVTPRLTGFLYVK